jgi:hypothetical protein
VKRMEKSPHFRTPQVEAENAVGEGAGPMGGNIQFEIAAVYVPFAEDSDTGAGRDEEKDKKTGVPAKSAVKPVGVSMAQKSSAASGGAR